MFSTWHWNCSPVDFRLDLRFAIAIYLENICGDPYTPFTQPLTRTNNRLRIKPSISS